MTQEEKELLFKDLCGRLPYGVIVETKLINAPRAEHPTLRLLESYMLGNFWQSINNAIAMPYLRPMSSMAAEELHEVQEILGEGVEIREGFILIVYSSINSFTYLELQAVFNWLDKHMFDYRGLIEKGLAIEAPEGMYGKEAEQ